MNRELEQFQPVDISVREESLIDDPDVPYDEEEHKIELNASKDGVYLGSFSFSPPEQEGKPWKLGLIQVEDTYTGRGVAKKLLTEFARKAGPGAIVSTAIIHEETLEHFEARNPHSDEVITVLVTDRTELAAVPICRVLNSGGIETSSLAVIYNSTQQSRHNQIREISLIGKVLPLPIGI